MWYRLDGNDAVLFQELVHPRALGGLDAGQDHVLLGGEPELRSQLLDDPPQPGP